MPGKRSFPEPNAQDVNPFEHDYTEGAGEQDLAEAIEIRGRSDGRRDSMSGWNGEGEDQQTAIFSGPGSFSVPSSVTTMHHHMNSTPRNSFSLHRSHSRTSISRGQGYDGRRGHSSEAGSTYGGTGGRRGRNSFNRQDELSGSETDTYGSDEEAKESKRKSVLGGIASVLGFRASKDADDEEALGGSSNINRKRSFSSHRSHSRPSLGRKRSSNRSRAGSVALSDRDGSEIPSSDEGDNWGYSSNDQDSDSDDARSETYSQQSYRSDNNDLVPIHRSPHSPSSQTVPLLAEDPLFHRTPGTSDIRTAKDENTPVEPFPPVDPLSGSKQLIELPDEDLTLLFTGYETVRWKETLWWIGVLFTGGGLGLVGRWVPTLWVDWVGKETEFGLEKLGKRWVLVQTPFKDINIIPFQTIPYPYPISTVFPPKLRTPSNTASRTTTGTVTPTQMNTRPAGHSIVPDAKDLIPLDIEAGSMTWEETMGFLKVVEYRYTRYALDERGGEGKGTWRMIRDWRDHRWTSIKAVLSGLDESTRDQRRILFGNNVIDIEGKGVLSILMDEVLHPFYIFQVASIVLWTFDDYYYYAFAIALISVSSILQTLIETKRTLERMREMSRFSCPVQALINDEWQTVDSATLVPGDIFDASDATLTLFPCDAVLLTGDAIVNESMLTGESVPVAKMPIKDDALLGLSVEEKNGSTDVSPALAANFLFSGTKIIRVRPANENPAARALALVVRTGFNTTKGALVRSMLFPKPMGFKFYRDSMRFIGVLGLIAGFGFLISVGKFIEIGIKWHTILIRALDLITVVVPPALPATLSIGTTFAIDRLRKLGIFCISPNRVNIGGKIDVCCFDKTGTLTEEGLEVLGIRSIDKNTGRFSELHSDVSDVPSTGGLDGKTPMLYALATCHSLKSVNQEIIGDPLDMEMFNFTRWILEEGRAGKSSSSNSNSNSTTSSSKIPGKTAERPQTLVQTVVRPLSSEAFQVEDALKSGTKHAHFLELGVIRTFDFVSSLRRMSVIVKRLKSPSMEVYVKGAPEVMADICDPASFPKDYDDLLSYYTKHGFRVIAIAGKSIPGLTWLKAQRMKREQAESHLQFLGLIIFENKLKPETTSAISVLRGAHLACRMVTGDNVRTAVSVARECGLVSQSASIFLPNFLEGSPDNPNSLIEWTSVDDDDFKLDSYTMKPVPRQQTQLVEQDEDEPQEYNLAVTGDVFRWMVDWAPVESFQKMLIKGVIFARMSPDEKHELVERLQGLGYTVCFCGDGANDCGALKAADVGISLSEAEASVAAPFTSRVADISCVIEVIKEGRAALVTSFSCFKYMALYSLIQFTTITLLYSFASSLGDFQFLYIDLFIIIPIAVAMGRTLPYPDIHPKRPAGSLVSKRVLTSIISQTIINAGIQLGVFFLVKAQPWYEEPEVNVDKLETINYENSALFLVSSFQYILVAAVFSVGPPYRKPLYTNFSLVMCLVVLSVFSTYVLLSPSLPIALFLDLMSLELSFKLQLLGIVILNVVLCLASERWAEDWIVRGWGRARGLARRLRWMGRRRWVGGKSYKPVSE
ncbi:ca-transporting atpase [Phaffia rhodozyma]|uniref:Cation-transporting ATPase n=1 Tax=Phaffia rhodozyma TaxID=264483 RepID=A0A0F7SWM8_PHARH|nr:ca-transporting atpase [Phaffia rhodozyma]